MVLDVTQFYDKKYNFSHPLKQNSPRQTSLFTQKNTTNN
jgi:hypothetical protein